MSYISSPKDFVFPETIPEEVSSVEEERVVILQLPVGGNLADSSFYTADASLLHQSTSRKGNKQIPMGGRERPDKIATKFDFDRIDTYSVSIRWFVVFEIHCIVTPDAICNKRTFFLFSYTKTVI